jgi:hypothetical protein
MAVCYGHGNDDLHAFLQSEATAGIPTEPHKHVGNQRGNFSVMTSTPSSSMASLVPFSKVELQVHENIPELLHRAYVL